MTIHEFGKENDKIMVLLHPAVVMWDFFGENWWSEAFRKSICYG